MPMLGAAGAEEIQPPQREAAGEGGAPVVVAVPRCQPEELLEWQGLDDVVPVPRCLLQEIIDDKCCPLHIRLQLQRACSREDAELAESALDTSRPASSALPFGRAAASSGVECRTSASVEVGWPLTELPRACLATVASYLPLPEVLSVRGCSREPLQWATQRGAEERGPRRSVRDRIQARIWLRQIQDVTRDTKDERMFETQMKSLADEALRSRMETEMQDALAHMEEQIRAFQAEVDRRLEEQEQNVRNLVDERVQQELDAILASEVRKVHAMVEERVKERVQGIFRREVRETVRELQAKLDSLVQENELLRDAFAEANLRAKSLFWAMHPPMLQTATAAGLGLSPKVLFSLKQRTRLCGVQGSAGSPGAALPRGRT